MTLEFNQSFLCNENINLLKLEIFPLFFFFIYKEIISTQLLKVCAFALNGFVPNES